MSAAFKHPYVPGVPSGLHFDLMRNRWSPKADTVFGEEIMIQPMRRFNQNGQPEIDPTREVIVVAGIFRAPREPLQVNQAEANKLNIALDRPTISIALAALPYALRRGDCLVRLCKNSWYSITGMRADSIKVRGVFEVTEFGNQDGLGGESYA